MLISMQFTRTNEVKINCILIESEPTVGQWLEMTLQTFAKFWRSNPPGIYDPYKCSCS